MNKLEFLPITPRALYYYACKHGLEDERIRICDGMAVSYFPTEQSLCRSKNKVVIDLSDETPVEWDELSHDDQTIVYPSTHNDRKVEYQYQFPDIDKLE